MKQIEINKEMNLDEVVDILSLETKHHFEYKKQQEGIHCVGPFFIKGRYSTLNEVKEFEDTFEFDIFASSEKLDGETFEIVYTDYDYSVQNGCILTLYFDVHGIYGEENTEEEFIELEESILLDDEDGLRSMEELFDEKDHVITSYSFVVVKKNDTYDSIAKRYDVDVHALKDVNKDKLLQEKDLVVLPYGKQN